MSSDAEDCGFQMLNDDEIVTSVQSDYVDDEADEDEDNNNDESSKCPSNVDAFSALEGYQQQSECCPTQLLLLKRIRGLIAKKRISSDGKTFTSESISKDLKIRRKFESQIKVRIIKVLFDGLNGFERYGKKLFRTTEGPISGPFTPSLRKPQVDCMIKNNIICFPYDFFFISSHLLSQALTQNLNGFWAFFMSEIIDFSTLENCARDAPLSPFARWLNISSLVSMFKTLRFRFELEAIAVHNSTKEHVYTPSLGNKLT
ncbi:UNVERIFIED_CONTAM: hypothetical protein NCL1_40468 [Trichonephila clavipes]